MAGVGKVLSLRAIFTSDKTFRERYALGAAVGDGSFGKVHFVQDRDSHEEDLIVQVRDVRTKNWPLSRLGGVDKGSAAEIKTECDVWSIVKPSRFVVQLREAFFEAGSVYVITERSFTPLLGMLQAAPATQRQMRTVFRQMALGMRHVHSCDIAHRSITSESFVCGRGGLVQLTDFSTATQLEAHPDLRRKVALGLAGPVPFMSPEMLNGLWYDTKTDVWSFGVTVYFILFGELPFGRKAKSGREMAEAIVEQRPPPRCFPEGMRPRTPLPFVLGAHFAQDLLVVRQALRLDSEAVLKHEYLAVEDVLNEPDTEVAQEQGMCQDFSMQVQVSLRAVSKKSAEYRQLQLAPMAEEPTDGEPEDESPPRQPRYHSKVRNCVRTATQWGTEMAAPVRFAGHTVKATPHMHSETGSSEATQGSETSASDGAEWLEGPDSDDEPLPVPRLPPACKAAGAA